MMTPEEKAREIKLVEVAIDDFTAEAYEKAAQIFDENPHATWTGKQAAYAIRNLIRVGSK